MEKSFVFGINPFINMPCNIWWQFLLELMQVPRVETKLRVFSFKIQFPSLVSGIFIGFFPNIFGCLVVTELTLLLFASQVSYLRTSLNVVNSAAEEASYSPVLVLLLALAQLFCKSWCLISLVLIFLSDKKLCEIEKNHADNPSIRKCFEPGNF